MVSLWPWKGDDNSPASFEKTLATLSDKHKQTTTRLDGYRQQARRFKALWTLYSIFIYLLYSTIDVLVLGRQNWGYWEYGAVLGGPFVIYIVRTVASRIFDYRISRTQSQLDSLNKQRDETIEKLKVATKYNSTQQLLDKYGGDSPSPDKSKTAAAAAAAAGAKKPKRKDASDTEQQQFKAAFTSGRTGIPPPPTANIRRPSPNEAFLSPPPPNNNYNYYLEGKPLPPPPSSGPYNEQASFAPNAFPPSQAQYDKTGGAGIGGPKWYDRLMDVLLGEDEASAKNRIVLICQNCRLVNGQAPPGVKRLDELGRWRCGGCGAWNGEESEAKKVLDSIQQTSSTAAAAASGDREEKEVEEAAKSEQQQEHEEEEHGEESDSEQAVKQEDEIGDDKSDGSGRGDAESSGVSTRTRSRRAKK